MRVDAGGRLQHRLLGIDADRAQPIHVATGGAGLGQRDEEGLERLRASIQKAYVHVVMRAIVDLADEAGLGIGRYLKLEAFRRQRADRRGIDTKRGSKGRADHTNRAAR